MPSLINNAITTSRKKEDFREYRYDRRNAAQRITCHNRLRRCGKVPVGEVSLVSSDSFATYRNIETCGSVWVCSVCSARILKKRALEISTAIERWAAVGGGFVFQTLTVSHHSKQRLKSLRKVVQKAFTATVSGRFAQVHKDFGQIGYFKVAEITRGKNGWHLHLHVMRFVNEWLPDNRLNEWHELIVDRWISAAKSVGASAPKREAQDIQQVGFGDSLDGYFTKYFDNPREASIEILNGSNQGRTTWELLNGAIADSSSEDRALWNQYEVDTKHMRQITWSKGLRSMLGMGKEVSDEELCGQEDAFDSVLRIERDSVRTLGSMGRMASRVLRHVEDGNLADALAILDEYGVNYTLDPYGETMLSPPD